MNNLYKLLNVSSDMQFGNLLDKLDLNPNELVCLESISNNFQYSMDEKRQMVLEMLAGSDNNYQIMKTQFKKSNEPRRLKESVTQSSPMNMNDVLELNELIELSYSKCNDNPQCAQDVYQMINKALGKNVADAYFSMVRNSVNTEDNLKFDTDLVIDGKNVAESILTIKSNIINYLNSVEESSKENVNESSNQYNKPTFTYSYETNDGTILEFNAYKLEDGNYHIDLLDSDFNYITTSEFGETGALDNNFKDYVDNQDWDNIEEELYNKIVLMDKEKFADEHNFDIMSSQDFKQQTGLTPLKFAKKYPIKSKNKELDEDTVYDQSWYKVKGGKYPRKTKEGIICEEELTTLNRIAGVYDINNNSFKELGKGEEHNLTLKDYQSGQVRYGIQDTKKYGMVCYITAIDRGYAYQTMKKIKSKYKDVNIDTFNLEFRTDDGKKMFIKLDNNGHQIFENKNIEHFTSEEIHNKLVQERKQLKETYDSLINDLEDAQQILYSTNRQSKYVDIINRYLKPYHKTIADLTWTGDFIDIIGEEQAQEAVDELYSINENNNNNESIKPSLFKTVAKPTEWIPAINGKVIPNAPSFGGAFGKDKAQEWLNNWLEKHGFSDYLDETCSAGTTCAGSVATVSTPMKSKKKRKITFAESLFLDMVKDGKDATSLVGSDHYKLKDGYFYKNGQLVKTKNLNEMVEFVLGNIELPLLEGFLPSHLDMLLETELDNEITYDDLTPEQRQMKQQEETELQNELNTSDSVKVSVKDSNDENKLETDQELIGVDNSDEQNKKYVVKNPSSNEIKIMNYNEIELQK